MGSAVLLSIRDWPSIRWLGALGETARRGMVPIRGNGDFLLYGSPRVSANAALYPNEKQHTQGLATKN
jgi:hypothetical protein